MQREKFILAAVGLIFATLIVASVDSCRAPDCSDGTCPVDTVRAMPALVASDLPASVSIALDLPPELRTRNWGGGSCVHASNVNLLIYQGQADMAAWWRSHYSGGEYDSRLVERLDAAGLRYAFVHGGKDADGNGRDDGEEFMEWTIRTRRGAGIFYKPNHSINLAGLDENYAYLLDNNAVNYPEQNGHYERVERREFLRKWLGYGGFAWTLVYDPAPARPYVESIR